MVSNVLATTMDSTGRKAMAEQKTAQQRVREQFRVAENTYQKLLDTWHDVLLTTTDWTFDLAERGLRYNQELRGQLDRAVHESLATHRKLYQDGLKAWQGYVQGINEIVSRALV